MEKQQLWEKICYEYDKHKFDKEEIWQVLVENYFSILGWEEQEGEITKPKIYYGSAKCLIPDIVINHDGENVLVVEIKKAYGSLIEQYKKQLLSYMKQLKLKVGILWGNSIKVFYDAPDSVEDPVKVCEIEFKKENSLGIELIDMLMKENFSLENLYKFCEQQLLLSKQEQTNQESIKYLCSSAGEDYIKELLSIEYPKEVVDKLSIQVKYNVTKNINIEPTKDKTSSILSIYKTEPKYKTKKEIEQQNPEIQLMGGDHTYSITDSLEEILKKQPNETIQNYAKRVFGTMYQDGRISEQELERMHDKEYSYTTFGIQYPLLCDTREERFDWKGHPRYYTNKYFYGNYYLCSEWWKDKTDIYTEKIYKWVLKQLNDGDNKF